MVKFQVRTQAQCPAAGIGIRLGEFGQGQTRLHLLVPFPQLAVESKAANDATADGFVRVEVAALIAVENAQAQTSAIPRLIVGSGADAWLFAARAAAGEQTATEQQTTAKQGAVAEKIPAAEQ
ncbi:hypothetical protein D3C81_1406590 [compost metagenome]